MAESKRSRAMSREVMVSRAMSKLLRHQLDNARLERLPGGYITVKDMLDYTTIRSLKVTLEEVQAIVADNDKQRFSMINRDGQDLIRANQGHSIKIENEGLLTPITDAPAVVHGTTRAKWQLIMESGLSRMGRVHIHFAAGLPTDGVISGMRNSSTILIYIDMAKAVDAGLQFWMSENGVILSEGDEDGIIKLEYFKKVEDKTGLLLVEDGKILDQTPQGSGQ